MPRPGTPIGQLTEREEDVARLMARGYTNPQIAEELRISFATAKWYVSQVITKLGATNREEAAAIWAGEQRWGTRLRRGLAGIGGATVLRRVAIAAGAVVGAGILVLVVVASQSGDDEPATSEDATDTSAPDTTPSPTQTATQPAVAADFCDDENLVNGFIVVQRWEDVPRCSLESGQPIPANAKIYEFDDPSTPLQKKFGNLGISSRYPDLFQSTHYSSEGLAVTVYRYNWFGLVGRTILGADPTPVDYLPGPGVMVERPNSVAVFWYEDGAEGTSITHGLEVHHASDGLTLREAAARLHYFGQGRQTPSYWNTETAKFVETWLPSWLYGDDASRLDAIMQAYLDGQSMEPFADTVQVPCGGPLPCAPGNEPGTPQEAVLVGSCLSFNPRPPTDRTIVPGLIQAGTSPFGVAREIDPPFHGVEYSVYLLSGTRAVRMLIGDSGVVGVSPLCPLSDLVEWTVDVDAWLLAPTQSIKP